MKNLLFILLLGIFNSCIQLEKSQNLPKKEHCVIVRFKWGFIDTIKYISEHDKPFLDNKGCLNKGLSINKGMYIIANEVVWYKQLY